MTIEFKSRINLDLTRMPVRSVVSATSSLSFDVITLVNFCIQTHGHDRDVDD